MKKKFKVIILMGNLDRLIARILIVLKRRNINICFLKVAPTKKPDTMHCILELESSEECMKKSVKQMEKQIGVISISYHEVDQDKMRTQIK